MQETETGAAYEWTDHSVRKSSTIWMVIRPCSSAYCIATWWHKKMSKRTSSWMMDAKHSATRRGFSGTCGNNLAEATRRCRAAHLA